MTVMRMALLNAGFDAGEESPRPAGVRVEHTNRCDEDVVFELAGYELPEKTIVVELPAEEDLQGQ